MPTIRPANRDDLAILSNFNCRLADETEGKQLEFAVVERGVSRLLQDRNRGFYLVAEIDDKVVGQLLVTYEWSDWRDGWFWWIQSVYVESTFRGTGVFKSLFQAVEAAAISAGDVVGLRLYVMENNNSGQAVYQALGMHREPYQLFEKGIVNHHELSSIAAPLS